MIVLTILLFCLMSILTGMLYFQKRLSHNNDPKLCVAGCGFLMVWMPVSIHAATLETKIGGHDGMLEVTPYFSVNAFYDSNVFRLESAERAKQILGNTKRSDVFLRGELGAKTTLRLSRQLFTLNLGANKTQYDYFGNLDYTGASQGLRWDAQFGHFVDGVFSYSNNESASGFNDVISSNLVVRSTNVRTTKDALAGLNWHIHPDWTIFGNLENVEYANSSAAFVFSNREENSIESGLRYANAQKSQLGLSLKQTETLYSNRSAASLAFFGDEHTRDEMIATFNWLPIKRITLSGRLAFVNLDYPGHANRNFDDISQRWSVLYAFNPNVQLGISAYQEVSPVDDIFSTFSQSTGFSVTPSWIITNKLSMSGSFEFKNQAYQGSSGFVGNAITRDDDLMNVGVTTKFQATRRALLQLSYMGSKRDSNQSRLDFTDHTVMTNLNYTFD